MAQSEILQAISDRAGSGGFRRPEASGRLKTNAVSWLEIIHVRLAAECPDELIDDIRQSAATGEPGTVVNVYRQAGVTTDIGVHINHVVTDSANLPSIPSALGVRLAALLKDVGMVQHTVWMGISAPT